METHKIFALVITVAVVVLMFFALKFKNRKEEENKGKFLQMQKEGDFKGMKQWYRKWAIVLSVLALIVLPLSIAIMFSNVASAIRGLILGCFLVWPACVCIRGWRSFKCLEERFSYRLSDQEVQEFWLQCDDDIFYGLYDYLFKKSYLEERMDLLNEEEKTIYVLAKLEMEVNNGGFSQFFFNTGGKFNQDIAEYACAVKASDIAKICENALDIINRNLSEDETDELLDKQCDAAFYSSEDSLANLCAEYAKNHKSSFLS